MWSRFTVIDDDVASIDSHDGQVDAQNRMIDREIERLSQILPNGLNELPLPIATILPPASKTSPPIKGPMQLIASSKRLTTRTMMARSVSGSHTARFAPACHRVRTARRECRPEG